MPMLNSQLLTQQVASSGSNSMPSAGQSVVQFHVQSLAQNQPSLTTSLQNHDQMQQQKNMYEFEPLEAEQEAPCLHETGALPLVD